MENKVNLELSVQELNIVLSGVAKLPIEMGLSVFNSIQRQADAQLKPNGNATGPLSGKIIN